MDRWVLLLPLASPLLFFLASCGGSTQLTTADIGETLGVSQQTISRWIRQHVDDGLVVWDKRTLTLSQKGIELLSTTKHILDAFFTPQPIVLKGKVFSGLGEGAYYVSLSPYRKALTRLLGGKPYPGTLNISLENPSLSVLAKMRAAHRIPAFTYKGRQFGNIVAHPATICFKSKKTDVFIVFPERSHHAPGTVEVVSKKHLRSFLSIKDGSVVTLFVH